MFSPSLLYNMYMRVLFGTLAHFVHFCLALLLKFLLRSFLCLAGVSLKNIGMIVSKNPIAGTIVTNAMRSFCVSTDCW